MHTIDLITPAASDTGTIASLMASDATQPICVHVPLGYAAHKREQLRGFRPKLSACGVRGFAVPTLAFRLHGRSRNGMFAELLRRAFGAGGLALQTMQADGSDGAKVTLILPANGVVRVHHLKEDEKIDPWKKKDEEAAIAAYTPTMDFLSRIAGRPVNFVYGNHGPTDLPRIDGISILTGATPPGEFGKRQISRVFGVHVGMRGLVYEAYGPTVGRGHVIKDEYGVPVVQTVDDAWYLLYPALFAFNDCDQPESIFDRAVVAAWHQYVQLARLRRRKPRSTPKEEFVKSSRAWCDLGEQHLRSCLEITESGIKQKQTELAKLHNDRMEYMELLRTRGDNRFLREIRERLPHDYRAIRRNPMVATLEIESEGIHVRTKPLVIEHDGSRYDLGAYVIRVSMLGMVSVWSEAPTHFMGIAHPHIGPNGCECFGNAWEAIVLAGSQQRFGDCIRHLLAWLVNGYSHMHTLYPVWQWPKVGESRLDYTGRRVALLIEKLKERTADVPKNDELHVTPGPA